MMSGDNSCGQLGNGTRDSTSYFTEVLGGYGWKQVTCGGGQQTGGGSNTITNSFVAGIKTDGTLWTWGGNNYGQLGDGTTISRSSPVQIYGGGTNWKQVALGPLLVSGGASAAAIKTDYTLWTWGDNVNGSLGLGNQISKSSPVQTIVGGNNWISVAVGGGTMMAVRQE